MKYFLIPISFLFLACSSKPTKDSAAPAAATPSTAAKTEAAKKTETKNAKKMADSTTSGDSVKCTLGDIVRELRIVQSPERCTVEYTKDGSTQEIGTGVPNSPFCTELVERVKNNLSAAGYKCE